MGVTTDVGVVRKGGCEEEKEESLVCYKLATMTDWDCSGLVISGCKLRIPLQLYCVMLAFSWVMVVKEVSEGDWGG